MNTDRRTAVLTDADGHKYVIIDVGGADGFRHQVKVTGTPSATYHRDVAAAHLALADALIGEQAARHKGRIAEHAAATQGALVEVSTEREFLGLGDYDDVEREA